MKRPVFFFAAVFSFIFMQSIFAQQPLLKWEDNRLEVKITNKADKQTLMDLKKDLADEYQITLDFKELTFNKKGKIQAISLSVHDADGYAGTCSTKKLRNGQTAFFYRNYNPGSRESFGIGVGKR